LDFSKAKKKFEFAFVPSGTSQHSMQGISEYFSRRKSSKDTSANGGVIL
jgi:hypothetical protein